LISSNDGINSYIFIDDLSRAIASREYDIYFISTYNYGYYCTDTVTATAYLCY